MGSLVSNIEQLIMGAEIQRRIDELEQMRLNTVTHPDWFDRPAFALGWMSEEIMQLESEQLAHIEKSRPGRQLISETKSNLITPIVAQWAKENKGDNRV